MNERAKGLNALHVHSIWDAHATIVSIATTRDDDILFSLTFVVYMRKHTKMLRVGFLLVAAIGALLSSSSFGYLFAPTSLSTIPKQRALSPFQQQKNAFKVIAGLHKFDVDYVKRVVESARAGGASHVDIACSADLVRMSKGLLANSGVSLCVSGIVPQDFLAAVEAGADMVEIGNFDGFYPQGRAFTAQDVLSMARETRRLLPHVALSVTVPHTLSLEEQISLAQELESSGADVLQTEGKVLPVNAQSTPAESLSRAASTLAATFALSRSVSIPVMCSSGIDQHSAPLALQAGARGVGVGRSITQFERDPVKMVETTRAISNAMQRQNTVDIAQLNLDNIVEHLPLSATTKSRLLNKNTAFA